MPKIRVLIFFTMSLVIFGSCKKDSDKSLSDDSLILEYFTKEEAKELQLIHDFFIDHICQVGDANNGNAANCLTEFMQTNKTTATATGEIYIPIEHAEKVTLLKQLNPDLFHKIWTEDYEYGHIGHDNEKPYTHFLYDIGYDNKLIQEYSENVMFSGGVNGTSASLILNQPDEFDMTDGKQRLMIAIHYITWDYNNHISDAVYGGL